MVQFFNDLKIGTKLGLSFGLLVTLTVILSMASFATSQLERQAFDALQISNEASLLAEQVNSELLKARAQEQNFLNLYPLEGISAAYDLYVAPHQGHVQNILNILSEMRALELGKAGLIEGHNEHVEDINTIETMVSNYRQEFDSLVNQIEHRGAIDSGEEGKLREAASGLEDFVLIEYTPELEFLLLAMRRHELAWELQNDLEDVERVNNFGVQLKGRLGSLGFTQLQRDVLIPLVDAYLDAFNGLVALDQDIMLTSERLQQVAQSITPLVDEIVAEENAIAEQARAELENFKQVALIADVLFLITTVITGIVLALLLTRAIAGPISRLSAVAQEVSAGNLDVYAPVTSQDEVGQLARIFNQMTARVRGTFGVLEEQVAERTQQLETVMEISRQVGTILDLNELMRQVVTLTKERFNYYHTHIYLLDSVGRTLELAEGYGEPGEEMKGHGHSILVEAGQSLVAQAARTGKIVTVEDVTADPNWLPNPLLPGTRAEIAVPVLLGDEIVGVLDVQSDKIHGLSTDDEVALNALASQVANAVRNARLFTETQQALQQAQDVQRLYTARAWEQFGLAHTTTNYEVRHSTLQPLEAISTPEAAAALHQKQTISLAAGRTEKGNGQGDRDYEISQSALATPLRLGDQIIGVLGIQDENLDRHWTADEIALIEAVSEQMSLAIENARLFEDTQQQANRESLTREISDKIRNASTVEEILQTTLSELSEALGIPNAFIDLNVEQL